MKWIQLTKKLANNNNLYYLTQYSKADDIEYMFINLAYTVERLMIDDGHSYDSLYNLTDGDYFKIVEDLDVINIFELIVEAMQFTHIEINKKIYETIFEVESLEELNRLYVLVKGLKDGDIYEFDWLLLHTIDNFMANNDIAETSVYELLADEDLRANGVKAHALHWAYKIPYNAPYLRLSDNEVYGYTSEEIILEALNDYNNLIEFVR